MPIVSCPGCKAKLNAPETAIGKKVKCRCGTLIDVPSAPKATSDAKQPAGTSKQTGSPPANTMGQLLDQLTKTDFSRAERKEEATGPSKSQKNAKALEPYRDAIGKSKKGGYNDGQGGGGGETDTLQIIAGLYFLFAGLHLVSLICSLWFPSLLGETLERAAVIFIVVTGVLNIGYDIVGGIGILLKKAWGWWLGVFGVGCLAGMTMPFVFLSLMALISIIRGRGNLATSTILLVVGGVGAAIFVVTCLVLNSIIQPAKMKIYGVKIPKVAAWLISIIGGVALGVAYIAIVLYLGVGDTLINRKE